LIPLIGLLKNQIIVKMNEESIKEE